MVEHIHKPLTEGDWDLLGHDKYMANDQPRLPSVRIDVPMPADATQLSVLGHRLAGLAIEISNLGKEAHQGGEPRRLIGDAMAQVRHADRMVKALKKDWERDLLQVEENKIQGADLRGRIKAVK